MYVFAGSLIFGDQVAGAPASSSLPQPYCDIPDLSTAQRIAILKVIQTMSQEVEAATARTQTERRRIHSESGTLQHLRVDVETWRRSFVGMARIRERNEVRAILTEPQRAALATAISNMEQVSEIFDFQSFAAKQRTPVWCWAAAIQMLFNYNGIEWNQEQIVTAVKGHIIAERATAAEVVTGVRGWRIDPAVPGRTWRAEATHWTGTVPPDVLVGLLGRNRLIILGLDRSHIVVLFRAHYRAAEGASPRIDTVTIFDPGEAAASVADWSTLSEHVSDWWEVWAAFVSTSKF